MPNTLSCNPSNAHSLDAIPSWESRLQLYPQLIDAGLLQSVEAQSVSFPFDEGNPVQLDVLRTDQLHPVISGNKWFKLKYNLIQACESGSDELCSFGGAWSNHLHALAYLGQLMGMRTLGIVRGEEHTVESTPMLQDAHRFGMALKFVSRRQFRHYRDHPGELADARRYVIPEGGDNALGMLGAASLIQQSRVNWSAYSHVVLAVGTGCTFAGVRLALHPEIKLVGVSALKGAWVERAMAKRMDKLANDNWSLDLNHHGGGFAQTNQSLLSFVSDFGDNTGIFLEPVYTGKAMMALQDLIKSAVIPTGSRILFIHSGGLQGARGFDSDLTSTPRKFQ